MRASSPNADLYYEGRLVGHCVLDGDGGADRYDFPTAKLNHALAIQAGFKSGEEYGAPWALSHLVAVLADWQDSGRRGLRVGSPISCRQELDEISAYNEKIESVRRELGAR